MLNWYEEDSQWLAALTASLTKANVEHLVAVDGAYALFPEARQRPRSGSEQAAAITECAHTLGIGVTIHRPHQPWRGNEVEKRNHLLKLALLETEPADWLLQLDADELVDFAPADLHQRLENAEEDVAGIYFFQRNVKQPLEPDNSRPKFNPNQMTDGFYGHRILFRARRDLRLERTHYAYAVGPEDDPTFLRGEDDWHDSPAECLMLNDMRVEHRHNFRMPSRHVAALEYYELRALNQIEPLRPEGQPVGV